MNQNNGEKPMVQNISCILPETQLLGGLFLGNVFGAQNAAILKQYGIRAMITASAETKINHNIEDIPFHLKIDAHDKDEYYIVEHVNDCIHFIQQNRKNTNVYVHCYAGVSRSSAIVAAYLMWKYRWTLEKTLSFMVFKRVVAKPNDGFYNQLKEVEINLKIAPQISNQPTIQQIKKQQVILKPNSPTLMDSSLSKRPSSTQAPNGIQKLQSPALQMQNFNPNTSGQQFYAQKGDPYMNNHQNPDANKSGAQIPQQNHSQIPIPKVLAKRQLQTLNSYTSNEYYEQQRADNKQKSRNSMYNDYMSPDVIPTSPRQGYSNKMSMGKIGQSRSSTGNYYAGNKDSEGSIYTYTTKNSLNVSNGMNAMKRGFESQQKTKITSRCIVRPIDLPGYKNY